MKEGGEDDAKDEERAICSIFARAVETVDDEFCNRRWVSLVRDNGKKFYVTRADEVHPDFNMNHWDTSLLERQWRSALAAASEQHGLRCGIDREMDLRCYVAAQQDRWQLYKKELFPGAALCAVLVSCPDQENLPTLVIA